MAVQLGADNIVQDSSILEEQHHDLDQSQIKFCGKYGLRVFDRFIRKNVYWLWRLWNWFEGILDNKHMFAQWLRVIHQVKCWWVNFMYCTIDHLIPAIEESTQLVSRLHQWRLMSSDLVFDEPDDFSIRWLLCFNPPCLLGRVITAVFYYLQQHWCLTEINGLYCYSSRSKVYNANRTQSRSADYCKHGLMKMQKAFAMKLFHVIKRSVRRKFNLLFKSHLNFIKNVLNIYMNRHH